ncbi:MAG: hypothetical protein J6U49_06435 [Alistipes sp.]|nr:hypothetical protein [Alistipes sp.]
MKIMKYLLGAVMMLAMVGCNGPFEEPNKKTYPKLESLVDTLWWSYDETNKIYYDILYDETTGSMVGYSDQERENIVSNRAFTYTFTHATDTSYDIIRIDFEDGQHLGGTLYQKGEVLINYTDVYFIQLFEVYESGEVIKNHDGTYKYILQMWRE